MGWGLNGGDTIARPTQGEAGCEPRWSKLRTSRVGPSGRQCGGIVSERFRLFTNMPLICNIDRYPIGNMSAAQNKSEASRFAVSKSTLLADRFMNFFIRVGGVGIIMA